MIQQLILGRMSTFGGPHDTGVSASEGLALIEPPDLSQWWFSYLFLASQPPGTTGLARRLNPDAYYCACRFDYSETSRSLLRHSFVRLKNPSTGKTIFARPADWGPNARTSRVVDISPGAAARLCLTTDDRIECLLITPNNQPA
jgi:hypothetical protein